MTLYNLIAPKHIKETYRPLPICESYNVSPEGYVYNFVGGLIKASGKRYLTVQLAGKGLEKSRHPIDYLVAITYLDKPNKKGIYVINHKNGNIFDNDVDNLEWILCFEGKYDVVPCCLEYRKMFIYSKPFQI